MANQTEYAPKVCGLALQKILPGVDGGRQGGGKAGAITLNLIHPDGPHPPQDRDEKADEVGVVGVLCVIAPASNKLAAPASSLLNRPSHAGRHAEKGTS